MKYKGDLAVRKIRNRELWFYLLIFAAGLCDGMLLCWLL